MEVKVLCSCGSKYKFDVQPVDGHMPSAVVCPVCGADGTAYANQMIAQMATAAPATAATHSPAPAPPMPAAATPAAAPAPASARLRLSRAHEEAAPTPAATAPASAPAPAAPTGHRSFVPAPAAAALAAQAPVKKGNFPLGVLGAALGAGLGLALWLGIFHGTGSSLKILALAVGFLTGIGAKLLSRDEGSNELGIIAGVLAVVAIFSAQYLIAEAQTVGAYKNIVTDAFQERLTFAKETLKAMPNESDQEIRLYLAKEAADEDEKPDPKSITAEDIKEFRANELPELKALVEGKKTLADFQRDAHTKEIEDHTGVKLYLIARGLGVFSIALMFVAVGTAYKIVANA